MDVRLDPAKYAGFAEGYTLFVSDAGGLATDDAARLPSHPLVPATIPTHGYVYDVKSGRLVPVPPTAP